MYKNILKKWNSFFQKIFNNIFYLKLGFLLLFVFVLFTYFFYIPKINNYKEEILSKNVYVNPAAFFIEKKDRIVDFQELREFLIGKYEKRNDYIISIYFEYLPTGANISVNKDEKIWPASLIKIPVAMSMMKKIQNGIWKLENELVILDDDKDEEYGDLYKKPTGTTLTIKNVLEESLINSDNTAHFMLLRNLDSQELEDVYVHLGMDDIIESLKKSKDREAETDNRITAKRYSIFFRSLYNATYLDNYYSELFLSILSNSKRDLLGVSIPSDIRFVHKTGVRLDEKVRADSGIIYVKNRPYVLTVMIAQKNKKDVWNEVEINNLFEDIGKEVYNYVTNVH